MQHLFNQYNKAHFRADYKDIEPHLVSDRCAVCSVFKEKFYDFNISVSFNL